MKLKDRLGKHPVLIITTICVICVAVIAGFTVGGLEKLGLKYTDPQGAYYVLVDVSEFGVKDDVKFCEWLAQYVGVAAVPGSSFFREDVNNLIRFHFAKQDDTLNEAINRLAGLRKAVAEAGDVEWR